MRTSRFILLAGLSVPLALAGCGAPGGAPLVSAQYPPGTGVVNAQSEPQPLNSLPPGAANRGTAPGATEGNGLSWTFGAR
jgi:hypothetical protein